MDTAKESKPPWMEPSSAAPGSTPWKEEAAARGVKLFTVKKTEESHVKVKVKVKEEGKVHSLPRIIKGIKAERPAEEEVQRVVVAIQKARRKPLPDASELPQGEGRVLETGRLISQRHYAAVGYGDTASLEPLANASLCGSKYYGLIDSGPGPRGSGARCLVIHSPPSRVAPDKPSATDRVRAGAILQMVSTEPGGGNSRVRVLFTTPEKYYPPGTRVSTLRIGVDASDWENLLPKQRRII